MLSEGTATCGSVISRGRSSMEPAEKSSPDISPSHFLRYAPHRDTCRAAAPCMPAPCNHTLPLVVIVIAPARPSPARARWRVTRRVVIPVATGAARASAWSVVRVVVISVAAAAGEERGQPATRRLVVGIGVVIVVPAPAAQAIPDLTARAGLLLRLFVVRAAGDHRVRHLVLGQADGGLRRRDGLQRDAVAVQPVVAALARAVHGDAPPAMEAKDQPWLQLHLAGGDGAGRKKARQPAPRAGEFLAAAAIGADEAAERLGSEQIP